jgi:hypothetical protein
MRAARFKPVAQIRQPANVGPQLVPPREMVSSQAPMEMIESSDPHSAALFFTAFGIAFMGAFTFAGSILVWLLVRNTGVNWMFQR